MLNLYIYNAHLVLEYIFRVVSDSTLDAEGTVDIGLTLRPPPVATPPREHRKPDMLVHSAMMCCRSSFVISGIWGRDEIVLELLPILRLRICGNNVHISDYLHIFLWDLYYNMPYVYSVIFIWAKY